MTKNNRFKKKALEEEAKNIVSSTPLEMTLDSNDFDKSSITPKPSNLDNKNITSSKETQITTSRSKQEVLKKLSVSDMESSTSSDINEESIAKPTIIPTITNKIVIVKEEKIKMTKLGTSIKMNLKKDLDKEAKKYTRTANNIVNILLDNLYDKNTKTFNLNIEKKDTSKITSYHIKTEHYKAIEKLSKSTGYNKSEIFNILLENGLSNIK